MSIEVSEHFQVALEAHKKGDLVVAKAIYSEILNEDHTHLHALANLALIYSKEHRFTQAIDLLKRGIAIAKTNPILYNQLGIIYERIGKIDSALEVYKQAIRVDPDFIQAYNNIGAVMYRQKRYREAVEIFALSLKQDPSVVSTYVNIGAACHRAGRYAEGIGYLKRAIEMNPNNSGAYGNLGNIYNKTKAYDLALQAHLKALELDPHSASNHANIGITYKNLAQYEQAKEALQKAIAIDPNFINAHFDLATTYLILGEYEAGFREYEWRLKKEEMRPILHNLGDIVSKPRFSLDLPTEGKTLLLWSEQGYGDMIQFARFAKELKSRFPKLTIKVEVREALRELFADQHYFDAVIVRGEDVGSFDYQLPLMSLAHLFGTSVEMIPTAPYLTLRKRDKFFIKKPKKKLKIGVAWRASVTSESYEGRVFDLKYFEPLMCDKSLRLYSFQVGDSGEIKAYKQKDIIDLEPRLSDFKQSALAMREMDLIITSDTSVAHLAGALRKRCFVMLQRDAEWRWGLDEEQTPWYPNTKMIRQREQGDWESAFEKLMREIEELKKR